MDLYRGKAKMSGEWVVGAAVCIGEKAYILGSESIFPERPAYHRMAMGCGIEDRNLQNNGYDAAEYGWEEALERYEDNFPKWIELQPETLTRCCDRHDIPGNVLFEGDVYRNPDNLLFEICYGKYMAYCPADKCQMENVGFFAVSLDVKSFYGMGDPMPLGETEEYAFLVGNIFDNPNLIQHADQEGLQAAAQPVLKPAT